MKVKILYFAKLREMVGQSQEEVEIPRPTTLSGLYQMVQFKYGTLIDSSVLAYAVNEEYVDSSIVLKDGDSVSFIPPVAGG